MSGGFRTQLGADGIRPDLPGAARSATRARLQLRGAVRTEPVEALIVDFVTWLAPGPRPYDEGMAAWRTACPRLPGTGEALARRLRAPRPAPEARATVLVRA